jgi:hypothetical protein
MNRTTRSSPRRPGQLVVRVRERFSADAQEATGEFANGPVASCGSASLRHPDNKLSWPLENERAVSKLAVDFRATGSVMDANTNRDRENQLAPRPAVAGYLLS